MGLWNGSGISWTICKQSAPGSRQITTPTPHHSIFTGRVLFLTPNQQCQGTEDKLIREDTVQSICVCAGTCCQWYIRRSCFATTTYRKVRIAASVHQLIFQVGFEANISVVIDSVCYTVCFVCVCCQRYCQHQLVSFQHMFVLLHYLHAVGSATGRHLVSRIHLISHHLMARVTF